MKRHSDIQREKELRVIKQLVNESAREFKLELLEKQREDMEITKKILK